MSFVNILSTKCVDCWVILVGLSISGYNTLLYIVLITLADPTCSSYFSKSILKYIKVSYGCLTLCFNFGDLCWDDDLTQLRGRFVRGHWNKQCWRSTTGSSARSTRTVVGEAICRLARRPIQARLAQRESRRPGTLLTLNTGIFPTENFGIKRSCL